MKTMLKYQELDMEIARIENELSQNEGRKNAIKMQQTLKDYQAKLLELNQKAKSLVAEFDKYREIFNSMADNLEVVNKNLAQKDEKKIEGLIEANDAIANNLLRLEKKISEVLSECDKVQNEYNNIMKSARVAKTNLEKSKAEFNAAKAETEQKIAGGCRMEISAEKKAKLKADGRIECENCGRIIYTK